MTFAEYVAEVSKQQALAGYPFASKADAERKVKEAFAVLADIMEKGESVTIPGFGTFSVREAAARTGRDIRTGETIEIPAKSVPKVSFSGKLKNTIAGK